MSGIACLSYLAIENWTFGFERIVDLRLKSVNTASSELSRAEGELAALVDQRKRMTSSSGQKRDELRSGINQRDGSIDGLTVQLSKEAEIHQKNLDQIRDVPHHQGQVHGTALASRGHPLYGGSRPSERRACTSA